MAALQAMGVLEDSPLRNPEQIPYPAPPSPVQSQGGAADEEDTPSMRELIHAIDTHMEMVDLEVTSNLNAAEDVQAQQLPTDQSTKEAPIEIKEGVIPSQPTDPAA